MAEVCINRSVHYYQVIDMCVCVHCYLIIPVYVVNISLAKFSIFKHALSECMGIGTYLPDSHILNIG